tara:strand:+ start:724 stop:1617 length:894 start_codon:yes stop_codon:yes gene_type:complete
MKWTAVNIPDLDGKTAIVTGANSGIGFETAKALMHKGAHVYLGCRNDIYGTFAQNKLKLEKLDAKVTFLPLDLADISSIKTFVTTFNSREEKLDILCNNAGIMMCPFSKTKDGFEMQFGTNHLGHFALTGKLMGLLNQTENSRVVTVSSLYHRPGKIDFDNLNGEKNYHPVKAYQQSKLANLLFTNEMVKRLKNSGSQTIAAASHPGWTATNLQKFKLSFRLMNPIFAQKPPQGALPTLFAATSPDISNGDYIGPDGFMEVRGGPKKVKSSSRAQNEETAEKLWQVSEKLTGVNFLN